MVKEIKIMLLRRFSLISALVVIGLTCPVLTSQAYAEPCSSQARVNARMMSVPGGELIEQLDLTDEQREEIRTIQAKYADDLGPNNQNLNTAYQELRTMMIEDTSEDLIRSKHDDIRTMRQQSADLRFESMLEVRQVLTTEQRQELADLMEQRRGRHGWGMKAQKGWEN
jgi:Spy/CpxP family protein refolding chaperone